MTDQNLSSGDIKILNLLLSQAVYITWFGSFCISFPNKLVAESGLNTLSAIYISCP